MKKSKQTVRPTNDSERSPSVHYANWKETIFLHKNLATLNKTERGLVHRITVDQKVMFRRFQNKLLRTKMAHARASGNKQQIQELQIQNIRRLHCESHLANQGDSGFIDKLEKNPCTFDDETETKRPGITKKESSPAITDEEILALLHDVMKNQPIEHSSLNLTRLSVLGHILHMTETTGEVSQDDIQKEGTAKSRVTSRGRPITTGNAHPQQNYDNVLDSKLLGIGSKSMTHIPSINAIEETEQKKDENNIEVNHKIATNCSLLNLINANNVNEKGTNPLPLMLNDNNKDYGIDLEKLIDKIKFETNSNTNNSKLLSLRKNEQTSTLQAMKPQPKRSTSIFEEIKRPDFRNMRLKAAKKVDYSNQVRDFIDGLSSLGHGVPDFDYYASKMQSTASLQVKSALPLDLPATPDEEYLKHTGDQTIRCITMPKIKMRKVDLDEAHNDIDYYQLFSFDNVTLDALDNSDKDSSTVSD